MTGRIWRQRAADDRKVARMVQVLGLPDGLARVLAGRGIEPDAAETWLDPRLERDLPDPLSIAGMERAAEVLANAVAEGRKVAVLGDYDVDGLTSATLLVRCLGEVSERPDTWIPDRLAEGYGPSDRAMEELRARGAEVVVTVDCGTTAFGPLARAEELGLEVVVVDHHVPEERLPAAAAVVNPNRADCRSGLGMLSAAGVTFLLLVALRRELRARGWFGERPEPDLRRWLDLAALGTVCDMSPLVGPNRALVRRGLDLMASRSNAGLRALADVAGIDRRPDVHHAGFVLGPRINAAGRVGDPRLGLRLLTTDDDIEAREIAERLEVLNRQRQAIEAQVLEEASAQAAALAAAPDPGPVMVVAGEGWHPGVAGIVASRLVERFLRPAAVVALDGESGRGSARSVAGLDIGSLVIDARRGGILSAGGGHRMAAGFSVAADRVDELSRYLNREARRRTDPESLAPELMLDGMLAVSGATEELGLELERAGPFGIGNPIPRFALHRVFPVAARVVGADHVSCFLADETKGRVKGIAFRSADAPLGAALLAGRPLDVAGKLRVSAWNGSVRPEIHIEDAAPAGRP